MRTMHVFAVVPRVEAAAINLRRSVLVVLVALTGASCGSGPTSPIGTQRTVSGWVQDTAFRRIAGVQVAIVGTNLSTVTGADGSYELTGHMTDLAVVRVAKEGYAPQTRATGWGLDDPTRTFMLFMLEALSQPVDVSGEFTMTLIADNACPDLPSESRSRTYNASMVPTNSTRTQYRLTVQGPTLLISDDFEVGVTSDFLALTFRFFPDFPTLMDQIAPSTYVSFAGTATSTITPAPSVVSAAFDGRITYCALKSPLGENDIADIEACGTPSSRLQPTPSQPVTYARCESKNHRLVLARR